MESPAQRDFVCLLDAAYPANRGRCGVHTSVTIRYFRATFSRCKFCGQARSHDARQRGGR